MGLKICPICELNYIPGEKELCDVCARGRRKIEEYDASLICVVCKENTVVRGENMCVSCLHEKVLSKGIEQERPIKAVLRLKDDDDDLDDLDIEPDLIEIDDDDEDDLIPEVELEDIARTLGVDDDEEEEEEELDDDVDLDSFEFDDDGELDSDDDDLKDENDDELESEVLNIRHTRKNPTSPR